MKNELLNKIKEIANNFNIDSDIESVSINSQGNINQTYVINTKNYKYLLQRINVNVFKEPYIVMKNITLVTKYLEDKLLEIGDFDHKTLEVIYTKDDKNLFVYTTEELYKEYYRMYVYVDNCISYDGFQKLENRVDIAYNAGLGFGNFTKLLNDFPINEIQETIPNFHNTPVRFNSFIDSIKNDVKGRAKSVSNEIIELLIRGNKCNLIQDKLGKTIPLRVTHNDTKINNVLMNKYTNKAYAIIDLDTVMPGSLLIDIADGIRSACNKEEEDSDNYSNVGLDMDLTKAYLKGYIEETYSILTKDEVKYMTDAIEVLVLEQCLRFLTDYLNGDTYFKIKYPEHNKVRFLNQLYLLKDIESKHDLLDSYIKETYNNILKNK